MQEQEKLTERGLWVAVGLTRFLGQFPPEQINTAIGLLQALGPFDTRSDHEIRDNGDKPNQPRLVDPLKRKRPVLKGLTI